VGTVRAGDAGQTEGLAGKPLRGPQGAPVGGRLDDPLVAALPTAQHIDALGHESPRTDGDPAMV